MKIFEPVHGFIHFTDLEQALIDSEPFQRLHYLHQLGIAYLVYPGGTHTRFEHSLGTMHLATLIFNKIALEEDRDYWRQVVRLAALCHDLGHLPFSHVAEKRLLPHGGHEGWTLKIIGSAYLEPIWKLGRARFPGKAIKENVAKLALGIEKFRELRPNDPFSPLESIYSQIVTGDFFGADRIDYLLRDARCTGVSYGLFDYHQLIEMLSLIPTGGGEYTIGVEENGIESCEALLIARHFMHRRVYQYSSAKAYAFHLSRFMEWLYRDHIHFSSVENYLSMSEQEILYQMAQARKDRAHPRHFDASCLLDRKKRFKAISLEEKFEELDLESFKATHEISDADIYWEIGSKNSLHPFASFSVLKRDRSVAPASQFSQVAYKPVRKSWLYLAPEYQFPV